MRIFWVALLLVAWIGRVSGVGREQGGRSSTSIESTTWTEGTTEETFPSCPDDCSGKGECVEGECQCMREKNVQWGGEACQTEQLVALLDGNENRQYMHEKAVSLLVEVDEEKYSNPTGNATVLVGVQVPWNNAAPCVLVAPTAKGSNLVIPANGSCVEPDVGIFGDDVWNWAFSYLHESGACMAFWVETNITHPWVKMTFENSETSPVTVYSFVHVYDAAYFHGHKYALVMGVVLSMIFGLGCCGQACLWCGFGSATIGILVSALVLCGVSLQWCWDRCRGRPPRNHHVAVRQPKRAEGIPDPEHHFPEVEYGELVPHLQPDSVPRLPPSTSFVASTSFVVAVVASTSFVVAENRDSSNPDPNAPVCAICLSCYGWQDPVRRLHCAHFFHRDCIDQWFFRHSDCPLCKMDMSSGVAAAVIGARQQDFADVV